MVGFRGSTQERLASKRFRFGYEKAANDPAVADDGRPLLVLGRKGVAAQMGEPNRAIAALQKLLFIPYEAAFGERAGDACTTAARSDVRSIAKRSTLSANRWQA